MYISNALFVVCLIAIFVLGASFIFIMSKLSMPYNRIRTWVVKLWYPFVLIVCSLYVISHFDDCIDLHFTSEFNGQNLLFLFWLFIIILPFFDSFEGFGISIKRLKQKEEEKTIQDQYERAIKESMQTDKTKNTSSAN